MCFVSGQHLSCAACTALWHDGKSNEHTDVVSQVIGLDVVNVWEYPEEELTIKRVDPTSYPELFFALQVSECS